MKELLTILFFILGACIISFLKVIAYDYPNISFTRRSHCDYCGRILRWFEIIPIVGYFIVHGRCFSCKNQINFYNSLQETIGGILFTFLWINGDWYYIPLFIMLTILAFMDSYYGYVYPIFYLTILPTLFWEFSNLSFLTAVITFSVLWLLSRHYTFGLGDIEVLALLGLIIGPQKLILTILLACFLCLGVFLWQKKRSFRFIPYISIATGIIYLIFSIKV